MNDMYSILDLTLQKLHKYEHKKPKQEQKP